MSTTSLKLPDDLKKRAVSAARRLGQTPHAFMVDAIEKAASAAEARSKVIAEAASAKETMLKDGKGYEADAVRAYLRGRLTGKKILRPKAKSWRN